MASSNVRMNGNRFASWTRKLLIGPDGVAHRFGTVVLGVEVDGVDDVDVLVDVEDVLVEVLVVVPATVVRPHTTWPMMRSPVSRGPRKCSWTALTVRDPSPLVTCSLRTTWNWSGVAVGELPGRTTPLNVWLGVGLAGSVTIVAGVSPGSVRSPSWLASIPLSVTRVAPLSVVDPVTDIAPVVGFVSLAV